MLPSIENSGRISPDHVLVQQFPEKVLQFGTGVLLKGLPDFFIQLANESGQFNGRVAMVKSTDKTGSSSECKPYTVFEKGLSLGKPFQSGKIVNSISREINANTEWQEVLKLAESPDLEIIIEEVPDDDDILVRNWRIQLDVKTTRKKLKEVQRIIEDYVKPIL
jgi:tagaturonate reductase